MALVRLTLTLTTGSSHSPVSRRVDVLWSSQRAAIPYRWSAISPNSYSGVILGYQLSVAPLDYEPRTLRRLSCIPLLDSHGRLKKNQKPMPHLGLLERVHARQPTRRDLVALVYQQSSPFKPSKDERLSQRSSCMETSRTNRHTTERFQNRVLMSANMCSTACVLSICACHALGESPTSVSPELSPRTKRIYLSPSPPLVHAQGIPHAWLAYSPWPTFSHPGLHR
jgi:hypothetical protein